MALPGSFGLSSKMPTQMVEALTGDQDSLAPFQGANAIPCPLGMDIESIFSAIFEVGQRSTNSSHCPLMAGSAS